MPSLCRLVSRRLFLHGVVASLGLCSCRTTPNPSGSVFARLREPVSIVIEAVSENDGSAHFEAWFSDPNGSDKLLDGILIKLDDDYVAFSTYCPHEACVVKLERDPKKLSDVVTDRGIIPDHEVVYCACHYSVFDPRSNGRHLGGPAPRGLYRFTVEHDGNLVQITHVEAAILDLYN